MKKPGLAAWLGSHHPWPRTHEIAGSNPASPTIPEMNVRLCRYVHISSQRTNSKIGLLEPAAYEHITKNASDSVVEWLLRSKDPSIRYFTLTDILGKSKASPEVEKAWRLIPSGPRVLICSMGNSLTVVSVSIRIRNGPVH